MINSFYGKDSGGKPFCVEEIYYNPERQETSFVLTSKGVVLCKESYQCKIDGLVKKFEEEGFTIEGTLN